MMWMCIQEYEGWTKRKVLRSIDGINMHSYFELFAYDDDFDTRFIIMVAVFCVMREFIRGVGYMKLSCSCIVVVILFMGIRYRTPTSTTLITWVRRGW